MGSIRHVRGIGATALALFGVAGATEQSPDLGPEARIPTATIRTLLRDPRGMLSFKGIPYAAPPVGDLRWHSPQPATWSGVRDATAFGNRCLSAWSADREPGPSRAEHCLNLNVWTAAQRPDEKRPVMVWIHRGGFQFGSSASPQFGGAPLAAKGVVVVTLTYRLGVLGFLAHPAFDREGPSGNYGLQDQLAALRWVQKNIARFGGDPSNVTSSANRRGRMQSAS